MTTAAAPKVVHARAPAKINVFLKVGALLEDGYHDVATAYQALSLSEEVRATTADDFSVSFSGPIDTSNLATDGSNLAIKEAALLARKAG
ncbi:MAG: 4-(cytidine 5-diphospho)-2-C-methyl-D-erythritol kinase, partial [Microbacteriaceae bacterium]|nr:4-(cytidine 5-diphospho)-2-C-methyl-D-erythritol kinase [Microbacteriaceae bacterium]